MLHEADYSAYIRKHSETPCRADSLLLCLLLCKKLKHHHFNIKVLFIFLCYLFVCHLNKASYKAIELQSFLDTLERFNVSNLRAVEQTKPKSKQMLDV